MELGIGARGQKTIMMGLPDGRLDTIPACDRQTDRHATTAKIALTYSVAHVKIIFAYAEEDGSQ